MVSSVKLALQEAGVRTVPQNRRVWQWLKDNGKHTALSVSKALNEPNNNVSSVLGQMRDRGMVISTMEMDQSRGGMRAFFVANPKMKQFELRPLTEEAKKRTKRGYAQEPETKSAESGPFIQVPAPVAPTFTLASNTLPERPPGSQILEAMNVRQAYALYLELRAMFERKSDE